MDFTKINWKTSLLGIGALLSLVINWIAGGHVPTGADISTVLVAFGLVAAADASKSSGS